MTGEVSNGMLYYLVNDDLGSVSMTLTTSGTVQACQLYTPYGSSRYTSGSMPTTYGFTAQRLDPSGLNYYHARYYDAAVGQFVSADLVQGPNRYGYTQGNPETMTDPTGTTTGCGAYADDQGCGAYYRQFPKILSGCYGHAHCVIFIDGPNIPGDPWNCIKCQDTTGGWDTLEKLYQAKYGTDNVGFQIIAGPDANEGADNIFNSLNDLNDLHYQGTVTLVGHSNGAAAIFHYFAHVASGDYSGAYKVSSFVALDAPDAQEYQSHLPNLLIEGWSQWMPDLDVDNAANYVKQNGISGIYAYDDYDALSGSLGTGNGAWISYHSSGNETSQDIQSGRSHSRLQNEVDSGLDDLITNQG